MPTPEPMSREQVEKILCRFGIDLRAEWRNDWKAIADTDATLRARVEALERERDEAIAVAKGLTEPAPLTEADKQWARDAVTQLDLMQQRLATLTRERDRLREVVELLVALGRNLFLPRFDHSGAMNASQLGARDCVRNLLTKAQAALTEPGKEEGKICGS